MAKFDKEKILEQLDSLKNLPQIKEVKALRQRLENELARFTQVKEVIKQVPSATKGELANLKRSSKAQRYWRFIKLAKDQRPDLSTLEVRRQWKKRKETGISDIPDATWQNLSG